MNEYPPAVLDADWAPATDEDLIRNHLHLLDDMHHDDGSTPEELAYRIRTARKYIRRSCRRFRSQSRKLTAFVWRLLFGSILFLLWAVSLAMLAG